MCRNDSIYKKIQEDLSYITHSILENYIFRKSVECILLTGSFGRGEGSVIIENGIAKPLNDYDLVLITKRRLNKKEIEKLNELSKKLAKDLGIHYVDIAAIPAKKLKNLPPTMFNYDMKYGSKVVYGDNKILDLIPNYKPEDVPLWEGIRLLFNRMAGILGGFSIEYSNRKLTDREREYLIIQINHMVLAWIDALNLSERKYSHLYKEKIKIFRDLYRTKFSKIFDDELMQYAEKAIKFKLNPSYDLWGNNILNELFNVLEISKNVFKYVINVYLDSRTELEHIADKYIKYHKRNKLSIINIYYLYKLYSNKMLTRRVLLTAIKYPLNHLIYISLPYVLFSLEKEGVNAKLLEIGKNILHNFVELKNDRKQPLEEWEHIKSISFRLWDIVCH